MKKSALLPAGLALLSLCLASAPAAADIEWQTGPTLKTTSAPVDIATSADGSRTFVLAEGGRIEIFDQAGNLRDTIAVDPAMDRITSTAEGNLLIVSSHKNNLAQQIEISYRFPFDLTDSPFLGKAEAPVVLALFSDFQ